MDNKPIVLIVDDNLDLALATRYFLERKRCKVLISDGHDVHEIIQQQRPDIIILDISLGDLDGREICKEIKQKEETKMIPVIMLSAHDRLTKAYGDNNADGYVMKPFSLDELLTEIQLRIKIPG